MSDFLRYIILGVILITVYSFVVYFYPSFQGFALGVFYALAYSFGQYFGEKG